MSDASAANYDKLRLGATLSSFDGDNNNHGDCFNYGSVSGCDEDCPAMLDNRCEIYTSEFVERIGTPLDKTNT
jgi:hypothetical protein